MSSHLLQWETFLVVRGASPSAPDGALKCFMTPSVAKRLADLGFTQPVPLRALPGTWWVANVDVAALDSGFEQGGASTQVTVSSEEIAAGHAFYYCEVIAGPLDAEDGFEASYLATDACDVAWLGTSARVFRIPGWVARRLAEQGFSEPVATSALADFYWVCGMGSGVQSTQEIEARGATGSPFASVSSGPYKTIEEAQYAFDVLWESGD